MVGKEVSEGLGRRSSTVRLSTAQLYALVFGVLMISLTFVGFFDNASFAVGEHVTSEKSRGVFVTNGWHNLAGMLSGLGYAAVAPFRRLARLNALWAGSFFLLLTAGGIVFADDDGVVFGVMAAGGAGDSVLHFVIGAAGLGAWLITPKIDDASGSTEYARPRPTLKED